MKQLLTMNVSALLAAAAAAPARAAPYWVAWEGNDYPENEAWEHQFIYGGADRALVDGSLRIDSTRNHQIYDQSVMDLQNDPEPGQVALSNYENRAGATVL